MTGTTLYGKKHCKAEFGAYCEVHEEHKPNNTIDTSKEDTPYSILKNREAHRPQAILRGPHACISGLMRDGTWHPQHATWLCITFEDRINIPVDDVDGTTKGTAAAGVDIENPGVEIGIREPGVKNPNNHEEDVETEHDAE